ncbi:MAG TPA: HD-GYP domain-containing protein [Acidobacteriaceae bacterium]|nr:HD-GYP domain-containing protein [Acidobacteriaceae bacterium]
MRFRTRAFLICFLPFALLLSGGFWMIQRFVQMTVRDGLRTSLQQNQRAIAEISARSELQDSRFLKVAGENPALKDGLQLLVSNSSSGNARRTVEDQLRELGQRMGFDFLLESGPNGAPLAAVLRQTDGGKTSELVPVPVAQLQGGARGLISIDGRVLQVASVPIDQNEENIGSLSVGAYFDLAQFPTPAVLSYKGRTISSNIPGEAPADLNRAIAGCAPGAECNLRLGSANWISLPMQNGLAGDGFELRSLVNVDAAIAPVQSTLHHLFLVVGLGSLVITLLCSILSSRSIVRPIAAMVSHLHENAETGQLPEFQDELSSIREIRELVRNYNRAAVSVRVAQETLQSAYVEFVGSLASALDARDRYTAGHSRRVSDFSRITALALRLNAADVERIRVGALLHDIGKIGVADSVLQKSGRLTDEEFAQVKEHPVIGRRILEGVRGLAPYLGAVELHHENWDGSGYPTGQKGDETPIDARIIHVADAYDAMTSDRSYRRGLTHERAIEILREYAGTQFDPQIVELFGRLPRHLLSIRREAAPTHVREPWEEWEAVW